MPDWSKAFDKVNDERMLESLRRLQVPDKLLNLILDIYRAPKFKVKVGEYESEYKTQKLGIQQGCPFPLYLFTWVLTIVFRDVKDTMKTKKQ